MAYRPPIAVFDACVLYPFHTRNLLVQCAVDRLVNARWTDRIHDEWMRNLAVNNPGLGMERLGRIRDRMKAAVLTADVQGYAPLVAGIELPDPDDRHVRCCWRCRWGLGDRHLEPARLPDAELTRHGLHAETPDQFVVGLYAAVPEAVLAMVANARLNLRVSAPAADDFVSTLERQGLRSFAAAVRGHLHDL